MNDRRDDMEALPDDIARLVDAARTPTAFGDRALARMERRLVLATAVSAGLAASTSATAGAAGLGAKVLALFARKSTVGLAALVVGVGLGAGGHALATRPAAEAAPLAIAATQSVDPASPAVSVAIAAPAPEVSTSASTSSANRESTAPSIVAQPAPAPKSDIAAERALVEMARTAAARSDFEGALAAVAKHEKAFPKGQLREERELVAVQALAGLGREGEARARGERFLRSYPTSVFAAAVRAKVRSEAEHDR